MKKTDLLYWIFTILFSGFMIFSAVPDAMSNPEAVKLVHDQLGYPLYFIPMIGYVKIAGAVVLLIPGIPRIKEWAYAGLIFDLLGATYSLLMIGGGVQAGVFMALPIIVGGLSYFFYHKKLKEAEVVQP